MLLPKIAVCGLVLLPAMAVAQSSGNGNYASLIQLSALLATLVTPAVVVIGQLMVNAAARKKADEIKDALAAEVVKVAGLAASEALRVKEALASEAAKVAELAAKTVVKLDDIHTLVNGGKGLYLRIAADQARELNLMQPTEDRKKRAEQYEQQYQEHVAAEVAAAAKKKTE